jgi:hypothetical protein
MRKALFVLALAASLQASPFQPALLDPLWSLFSTLDEGCGWDPYGRCNASPQLQADEGCGMDPYGRCNGSPQPQPDAGCGWDPYGLCQPGS